jgi:hypothetical protein
VRCRIKPYTIVKCFVTVTIGCLVGLLAVALGRVTEGIIAYKNSLLHSIVRSSSTVEAGIAMAVAAHVAYSVTLVLIGSALVGHSSDL